MRAAATRKLLTQSRDHATSDGMRMWAAAINACTLRCEPTLAPRAWALSPLVTERIYRAMDEGSESGSNATETALA